MQSCQILKSDQLLDHTVCYGFNCTHWSHNILDVLKSLCVFRCVYVSPSFMEIAKKRKVPWAELKQIVTSESLLSVKMRLWQLSPKILIQNWNSLTD